ncbi:MAG: hypothetical protein HOQ36_07405 [Nocardia sp.]|nr:hypothetical protein [Nocardia sp.]NUS92229.1 hypothetical protein [Nocardia sp.]
MIAPAAGLRTGVFRYLPGRREVDDYGVPGAVGRFVPACDGFAAGATV